MEGNSRGTRKFRPHFSSSINSYLYATPCFLSIRVRAHWRGSTPPAEFPRDIAGICQSILRRASARARELARSNSAKVGRRLWKLMSRPFSASFLPYRRPTPAGITAAGEARGRHRVRREFQRDARLRIRAPANLDCRSPFHRALPFLECREYSMTFPASIIVRSAPCRVERDRTVSTSHF